MCDTLPATDSIHNHHDRDGYFTPGTTEITMKTYKEEDILINESFITKLDGKIYCKHPDTDWHLMEVKPGEMLHCPAETELKMVLPEPYVRGSI